METQCTSLRAPKRAILVDHELGHHKQADALDAFGRAGHAGQHQMDDVLGHVVLTPGDENLGAENLVAAVGLRLGAAAHGGQVATGLWLGQVHGAGPFAADQVFQVGGFEFVRACGQQRFNRAIAQQRAQRKAHVGAVDHLAARGTNGLGQALAAKVGRVLQALPAAIGELLEGFLETRGGGDHAVFPARWVFVAFPVQRAQHAFGELGGLFQHGLGRVQTGIFKAGKLGDLFDVGQVFDVEQHVLDGGDVAHGSLQKFLLQAGYAGLQAKKKGIASDALFHASHQSAATSSGTATNRSASRP